MGDNTLQFALREVRDIYSSARNLAGMAVLAGILGVAGPFGTFESMSPGARIAYWAAIVFLVYGVGTFSATLLLTLVPRRWPHLVRAGVAGLGASVPVTLAVVAINVLSDGHLDRTMADILALWGYCAPVAVGVSLLHAVMHPRPPGAPATAREAEEVRPDPPPILDRLPVEKRGPLIEMTVQDHYVSVTTARGTALVLMRLSDAIGETRGIEGLRIHRSHWVARDAVTAVRRRDGKVLLETRAGSELPVSRTYLGAVRAAGLLS